VCKVHEVNDDVSRFVERFASVLEESGMPRMPSRVFAALLATDSGRATAAELSEALQVSAAAVSGAVRYLIQTSLVSREREPGSRRDVYSLHDDEWYEAIYRREAVLARWQRAVLDGVEAVGPETPAGARLRDTAAFFAFLETEMPAMLARWRASRSH
jgi:DNA-binding transcriptional regulator GbsR (MarR family)